MAEQTCSVGGTGLRRGGLKLRRGDGLILTENSFEKICPGLYAGSCSSQNLWKAGRLRGFVDDTGSIPHHQAADYLSTTNPDFHDLCAFFTDVCTAIATYNAANKI